MLPIVKVYEIDYDFIIKNYLDPKLWNKIWTVFAYKEHVFTLQMTSINVTKNSITFRVSLNDLWADRSFSYNIKNSNIDFLKKSLNGEIRRLIENYEEQEIRHTDEYYKYCDYVEEEEDRLVQIAENFLDENGVSNEEIREIYIDNYISENSELDSMLNHYVYSKKYTLTPDLYLIFAKAINDKQLIANVNETTKNQYGETYAKELEEEINEIYKAIETEEWEENMKTNLKSI